MQTLDAPHPNQRDVQPGRVLASRGTGPGMQLGWSGMTLAIDGRADPKGSPRPAWRRSCGLRDAGRDGVRDAAGGLRDSFDRIEGISGLSGIAPAVLRSLECAPSGREWSSP